MFAKLQRRFLSKELLKKKCSIEKKKFFYVALAEASTKIKNFDFHFSFQFSIFIHETFGLVFFVVVCLIL